MVNPTEKNQLEEIKKDAITRINSCTSTKQLLELKTQILGRKSELNGFLKQIGNTNKENKKQFGIFINNIKKH